MEKIPTTKHFDDEAKDSLDSLRPPRYDGYTISRYAVRYKGNIVNATTMDEVWSLFKKRFPSLTEQEWSNVEVGCLTNEHGFVDKEAAEEIAFHTNRQLTFTQPSPSARRPR